MNDKDHGASGTRQGSLASARDAGLMACRVCGALHALGPRRHCRRCGHVVRSRQHHSLQRVWAFLLVGFLCYVPANLYPIMRTRSLTGNTADTIFSGIIALAEAGDFSIALIVFVASIVIPLVKFVVIALLALSIQGRFTMSEHWRHRLHTITEFIGRWSMIDVFVVAVLAALIQLRGVLYISPGIGINAFAASVVFTMLAANAFDPRLIWDGLPAHRRGLNAHD